MAENSSKKGLPSVDALPSPLPALQPPAELRSLIFDRLNALEPELEHVQPVLDQLTPPSVLKLKVFSEVTAVEGASNASMMTESLRNSNIGTQQGLTGKHDVGVSAYTMRPRALLNSFRSLFVQVAEMIRSHRVLAAGSMALLCVLATASVIALTTIYALKMEALRTAELARSAEQEAKQFLATMRAKELEYQKARQEAELASAQLVVANAELRRKNEELQDALRKEISTRRAIAAMKAEQEKLSVLIGKRKARYAAERLTALRLGGQESTKDLRAMLGSPMVKTLK